LPELAQDRRTQLNALAFLGRAAFARGDCEGGAGCWERVIELKPNPIERVSALYYLGECHEHLHDSHAAQTAYREAIAMAIDSHNAHRARQQLAEMSRSGPEPPLV
jgi:TolA-binding protein